MSLIIIKDDVLAYGGDYMQGDCGEKLVAGYYKYACRCNFVDTNIKLKNGELDVVGIDLANSIVYVAEVAVHLSTGLRYTSKNKSVTTKRLVEKFEKDIVYIKNNFPESKYKYCFELWSPIVKDSKNKNNINPSQCKEVDDVIEIIRKSHDIEIEPIINKRFQEKINELKVIMAKTESAIEGNDVLRYIQLEAKLSKYLSKNS